MTLDDLRALIRDVPDFPKPGILFKDITPMLLHPPAFQAITERFAERYRDQNITMIAAPESRGFIFGAPLAVALGVGLVLVRKPGKLPHDKVGIDYDLEYGQDRLEIHADALGPDDRVILVDDLLATGGTAAATATLIRDQGASLVEAAFVIELAFLKGRERFGDTPVFALLDY